MSPRLKKILKWVGLFYLAIFVLGIVSHVSETAGGCSRKPSRGDRDIYSRTFDGPFVDSYDGQGDWKAACKLHFLGNGLAVYEYSEGSDKTVMDLYSYRAEGQTIELDGVEHFEIISRYDGRRQLYNTFRRTGRRPVSMHAESLRSKRGRDIRVFADGTDEPVKFHQSTPVKNVNKRTMLSRERMFFVDLYAGTYADRMPQVRAIDRGDYVLLTPYPGADSVEAPAVGDQQRLLALMKNRELRSEPFAASDRRVASREWSARMGGTFNGLWAGTRAVWAFLPLTAILIILGFLIVSGYGEPDEPYTRSFGSPRMSMFHSVSLLVCIVSGALLIWYVASTGGMCMWFLSVGLPFSIINAVLALVFCTLLCILIGTEHVELVSLYGLREPRGEFVEKLAGYGLVAVMIFSVIGSAVASDGSVLPAQWSILGVYLLFVLVTLPRTVLRLRGCRGPRPVLLLFFLLCYPLRYPLIVANIIANVIHGVGSIKGSDSPEPDEPDDLYVTDVYGNTVHIHKMPNGGYSDNCGQPWARSGNTYRKVGDGMPFSR